jgi:uncharacterized protein DUF6968
VGLPLGNQLARLAARQFRPRGDAIQALLHALEMIGAEIYTSEEHRSGRLVWSDGWKGYGFPVSGRIRDLLVGDDAKFFQSSA